jgi:formylglycine-generating enzyme required for sulfatase activity
MGSPTGETGRNSANETQHSVTLTKGFYMGIEAVTQRLYEEVMGAVNNKSWFHWNEESQSEWEYWKDNPVECVTWYQAVAFCNALSVKDGLTSVYTIDGTTVTANWDADGFRLPTEAEWEYACRAGTTGRFSLMGRADVLLTTDVNYNNSIGFPVPARKTEKNNKYIPISNVWGLYAMHGNVREWCWDWYAADYGGTGAQSDPTGPSSGTQRVTRGGAFDSSAANIRSAYRNFVAPSTATTYDASIGFRIVRFYNGQADLD